MVTELAISPYYKEMLFKHRLYPFAIKQREGLMGFITFYIGNKEDEHKFVREDMWDVLEDNPEEDTCWIDQLITNKARINAKLSYEVWGRFKNYIKTNFPTIKLIRWNRYNKITGEVKTYKKEIRNE